MTSTFESSGFGPAIPVVWEGISRADPGRPKTDCRTLRGVRDYVFHATGPTETDVKDNKPITLVAMGGHAFMLKGQIGTIEEHEKNSDRIQVALSSVPGLSAAGPYNFIGKLEGSTITGTLSGGNVSGTVPVTLAATSVPAEAVVLRPVSRRDRGQHAACGQLRPVLHGRTAQRGLHR